MTVEVRAPRVALVTGGGTGIGRGVALALARRGIQVALAGRRPEPLADAARELAAAGGRAVALPADLRQPAERAALLDRVQAQLGPLDILVNNAGVLVGGPLDTLAGTDVEDMVAVNLAAPIDLVRLALPDLRTRRGSLVLVASVMGRVPMPAGTVYGATKAGLIAFGAALRYELDAHGVRLLLVYPPSVDTAMVRGMARAAGWPGHMLDTPARAGERIVSALAAGRQELAWGRGERALMALERVAPGLVRAVFRRQRDRFTRMMLAPREERGR